MKRLLCILLSIVMTFGYVVPIFAEDTITITENSDKNTESTEITENSESAAVEVTPIDPAAKTTLEVTPQTTFVSLGADLNATQRQTVLSLMGLSEEKLSNCNVVYVTNKEEHEFLDNYLGSDIIGHNSLSSVLVRPASTGHGVTVSTKNITYCSDKMYQNALITAGVTDADVLVVGPSPISGTAALIGALKAYSEMSGKAVDEKALDTALDELVTAGEVKEAIGDDEAAELISYVKAQIAANDLDTKDEIEAAVRQGDKELNANLTEDQIQQIINVMVKIKEMGIDFNVLAEQADTLYAKYGDQIKAGTFNLNDVDWADLGVGKVVTGSVTQAFGNLVSSVKKFITNFSELFGIFK